MTHNPQILPKTLPIWDKIWVQLLIILILTLLIAYASLYTPRKSHAINTAVQGNTVLFNNSVDQHNPDPGDCFLDRQKDPERKYDMKYL